MKIYRLSYRKHSDHCGTMNICFGYFKSEKSAKKRLTALRKKPGYIDHKIDTLLLQD